MHIRTHIYAVTCIVMLSCKKLYTEYKSYVQVKELIKRLKKWKKGVKWEHGGPPSSYLLEILMIMACEMYCTEQGCNVKDLDHHQNITDIALGYVYYVTATT